MTTIWITRDGMVSLEKVEAATPDPHVEFANIVRDAVIVASSKSKSAHATQYEITRAWQKIHTMLEKHDECTDELIVDEVTWMLPLVVVATPAAAKRAIVRFCKMGIGQHQLLRPDDRWYFIPNFGGTVEDLWAWSTKFDRFLKV